MEKLVRVEPGRGGITRQRKGRGFTYVSANGRRVGSTRILSRIESLVIPPAWDDVWIASQPNGHIQATGVDEAGRRQYLYHPKWREMRDSEKFTRSLSFGQNLPTIRRAVTRDLKQTEDGRTRALAAAVRLIDRVGLRVGGQEYADENGSFGASTLQRRHVTLEGDTVHLRFKGKSAGDWDVVLNDDLLLVFFEAIPKSPRSAPAICYPIVSGRRKEWHGVSATDINGYIGDIAGPHFTAKDFRTWQGTVIAARSLAQAFKRGLTAPEAQRAAIKEASVQLHNTPTVARDAYVNPRIFELFERGRVADLKRQPDQAVVRLLTQS
ncbi:DNA topoisomerase IB [Flaviflexus huanghaiensis]|uniref:DNA topoisomerase IB n=1 Tax=Flaviflexus huanghaiensis TaxID=1111473 RepID=UPI0015FA0F82|nr:DNA topoisomerase IB [Flaviflexus huanghaiensis]